MPKNDRPSATAQTVLAGVWLTACDPDTAALVSPELASYTLNALSAIGSPLVWALRLPMFQWFARRRELRVLPGICTHYAARKQKIFNLVAGSGADRLIVLGAGLDGLAYHMADRMKAVEIDWPASQEQKRRILAKLGGSPPTLMEGDFSDPGFLLEFDDVQTNTTFAVAEGVLMYLTEECVRNVFRQVAACASTFVFTFVALAKDGRPAFAGDNDKVDRFLVRSSEPFLWGIDPSGLEHFLRSEGWELHATFGADNPDLPRLEVVSGMIPGEWIVQTCLMRDS